MNAIVSVAALLLAVICFALSYQAGAQTPSGELPGLGPATFRPEQPANRNRVCGPEES